MFTKRAPPPITGADAALSCVRRLHHRGRRVKARGLQGQRRERELLLLHVRGASDGAVVVPASDRCHGGEWWLDGLRRPLPRRRMVAGRTPALALPTEDRDCEEELDMAPDQFGIYGEREGGCEVLLIAYQCHLAMTTTDANLGQLYFINYE